MDRLLTVPLAAALLCGAAPVFAADAADAADAAEAGDQSIVVTAQREQ